MDTGVAHDVFIHVRIVMGTVIGPDRFYFET